MMNDEISFGQEEDDEQEEDGWKILKPGVILFETTIGSLDKPVPHPILDNPSKMMRIIANPLYDKLTLSRAAQINNHYISSKSARSTRYLSRSREKTMIVPLKSEELEQTTITSLSKSPAVNNNRAESKSSSNRQTSSPVRLPTPGVSTQKPTRKFSSKSQFRAHTARLTSQSIQSALIESTANMKKPTINGTIRYVNSRHGFEVQRYAASNWLSTDVFTKDACQSHEKTFREMLDKKRQYERLSRSIYSSDYYYKRWKKLLESYKKGLLTHAQWAQQNYQLICVQTLYQQAKQREQHDVELDAQDVRCTRAQSAYQQWKQSKTETISQSSQRRATTAEQKRLIEEPSCQSNHSFSTPISITTDEYNTTLNDTNPRMSISTADSDAQQISNYQPMIGSKHASATEKALYMLDEQRWSLQAMLKRVVGLAEPLPAPPKLIHEKQLTLANISLDSGFESVS